jgi:N-acetylglucosaminyl-diphospho-decaprenol L-rhamnosyltransferase
MSPFVAVLIVSYKGLDDIRACLYALNQSVYKRFKIIICENGGDAAFRELQDALPEKLTGGQTVDLCLAPGNLGFAGGVHLCLERAGVADAYWILNPDTEPDPRALSAMLDRLGRGDCDAVGHDLILPNGRLASRGGFWHIWTARGISIDHGRTRNLHADMREPAPRMNYIVGASMLVSRDFVSRVGLMREDYFLYCEEVEWFLRAQALGLRLGYAPDALVMHSHGTSTGGGGDIRGRSRISVYLIQRNSLLLTRDLFPRVLPIASIFAVFHLFLSYGKARAWRQAGYALAGWWAGLRNERGRPAWF